MQMLNKLNTGKNSYTGNSQLYIKITCIVNGRWVIYAGGLSAIVAR